MATITRDTYVYNYPASNATFPLKVTLPTAITGEAITVAKVVPAPNVVGGNVTSTPINIDPKVTVDTSIVIPGLNDGEEGGVSVNPSDIFKDITLNPEIVQATDLMDVFHVKGDGTFDKIMETAFVHLDAQLKSGNIRKENYGTEHLQIFLATLQMLSGQWLQLEIEYKRLQTQAAIEAKRLEVQVALANKQAEIELARINKANEIAIATDNLHTKVQVETTNSQTGTQVALADASNSLQGNLTRAQLAQEAKTTVYQAGLQKSITDVQSSLQLEIAQEQLESAELQNTANITSAEKQNTARITSSEKVTQLQITSAEKQNTDSLRSAEKQNTDRIAAQAALIAMQVKSEEQKMHLYRRQIEGFDEDYKQKIMKMQLDSWAVGASVARDNFATGAYIPATVQKASIDSLYTNYILKDFDLNQDGIPVTNKNSYKRATTTLNGY